MKEGKVLIGFSLLWIILWCAVGFIIGIGQGAYVEDMEQYANDGNLAGFWATFEAWKAHSVAHSHGLHLSMVAFLVGLAMAAKVIVAHINFRATLTLFFMVGIALVSIADWVKFVPGIVIGDMMFTMALVMAAFSLVRSRDEA